jgi:hypothetical protein
MCNNVTLNIQARVDIQGVSKESDLHFLNLRWLITVNKMAIRGVAFWKNKAIIPLTSEMFGTINETRMLTDFWYPIQ